MRIFFRSVSLLAVFLLIAGGSKRPNANNSSLTDFLTEGRHSRLERIKKSGTLRVLTRIDPTTYREGPDGFTGFEYDLVRQFAKRLGVKAEFIVPETFQQMIEWIAEGQADIAAAGLTVTEHRKQIMRFSPSYQEITEQLVYRAGTPRPKSMVDLTTGQLEVAPGTSHVGTLEQWKGNLPNLNWTVNRQANNDGLLYRVAQGQIDYTVVDSNKFALVKRFHPELRVAFDISNPRQLAWALPKAGDSSLYDATVRFFADIEQDKTLAQLIDRHYGHTESLDDYSNKTFRRHVAQRLPNFRRHFEYAARQHGIDWRLLAAIGYQESHWHNGAVSPTGVRGIMMLTNGTAKDLGVKDRTDPKQSIAGGSRYFLQKLNNITQRVAEPDRTWLALAAYNVGFGHLQDARNLAKKHGADPDKWLDVKQFLPLLSKAKWHRQTKYGYARGREPVRYVENIRAYYDLLVWLTEGANQHPIALNTLAATVNTTPSTSTPAGGLPMINVLSQSFAL